MLHLLENMLNSMLQLEPAFLAKEKNIEEITCKLHSWLAFRGGCSILVVVDHNKHLTVL